ncbi:MAG: hypothetical protein JXJ04_15815 [Spirochaetales bacterium]|nr:hypothetical protein [Spirochaetales bacterium]
MKYKQLSLIILLISFTLFALYAEESGIVSTYPDKTAGLSDQEEEDDTESTPKYHFFGQSLCVFIPFIDERIKENNEIERNIYPFGIGGGLEYRTYLLNHLFSSQKALPGLMLGITFTFYMMEPQEQYQESFGELTILTGGLYTGYQFVIPVSKTVSISPALYAGGRYYISFHFFEDEISTAYNPIIIGGIDISIIFNNAFSISLRPEYQIYIEEETKQIINIFIGSGIFF